MTETVTQSQFADFVSYMRVMLNDMAEARIGSYPNNSRMQEIVVVWRPGDVSLDGYPQPENITHIKAEPHGNAMDMGEYLFKQVVHSIMAEAGYRKRADGMSISGMKQGQYACNMGSGFSDDMKSQIYYIMIRANGDLGAALNSFKNLAEQDLQRHCLKAMARYGFALPSQPAAPAPVPGGP